jgi:plasmid stabilization system protein ParE
VGGRSGEGIGKVTAVVNLPVILSEEAQQDFDDAADWYEQQKPGLGMQFIERVNETLASISAAPKMHQIRHKRIRRAPVRVFPYGVFYRVYRDKVVVIAIVHDRRDPSIWKGRR